MRILIISRTPWNNTNSFGNTFTNLFGGMEGVEIYSICCQQGNIENDIVKDTLQLSEAYLLRGFLRSYSSVLESKPTIEAGKVKQMQELGKKKRSVWMFFARDMIWTLSSFRWKKLIVQFLKKTRPDIIYLPIYASLYMCDVGRFAIKQLNVPVLGHISDDVYGYPPENLRLSLSHFYRYTLRKKIRSIIRKCSYLEVFAENMKEEYEREFCKPCYLIGKGVHPEQVMKPRYNRWHQEIHFVYTGGLGGERFKMLMNLAKSLEYHVTEKKCYLDIYSTTPLAKKDEEVMLNIKPVVFHGAIGEEEIKKVQQEADCLVHVEGFTPKAVFEAGMSFSTKIVDYLSTGNLLLAIGPDAIYSIHVLAKNNMAVVIDNLEELSNTVDNLLKGKLDKEKIQNNAYKYLVENRNIDSIQDSIYMRMKTICKI